MADNTLPPKSDDESPGAEPLGEELSRAEASQENTRHDRFCRRRYGPGKRRWLFVALPLTALFFWGCHSFGNGYHRVTPNLGGNCWHSFGWYA